MSFVRGRFAASWILAIVVVVGLLAPAMLGTAVHAETTAGQGPRLLGVFPSGGGRQGRDAVVALSFDRRMDLESLEKAVGFEPPVPYSVSGEAECLVVPVNLLAPNREYKFRLIPGVAEDLQGIPCDESLELSFTTRSDGMAISIPAFSFSGEIVEGNDPQGVAGVIGFGVGQYPGAGRPGHGNFVLMAHASGQVNFPFNHIFELVEGDEIIVTYGGRDFVYDWNEAIVVNDTDVWIVDPTANAMVTTFVCCAQDGKPSPTFHPPYRYVVRAGLASTQPSLSGSGF